MNAGACLRGVLISLYVASVSATPPTSTPAGSWKELQEILRDRTLPADWRDSAGYSLVYYHLQFGSEERALELLEKMPPTKVHMEGRDRLLTSAVKQGSQRMVQRLLQMGESTNVLKPGEISPLMTATKEGEFEIMRMLMKAGADPNYKVDGRTAAHQALEHGNQLGFHLLVDGGLDLKAESQIRNEENLLFAVIEGGVRLELEYLVEAGFKPDLPRSGGLTPLQLAADQLRGDAIDSLMDVGANPCLRDSQGRLPAEIYQQRYRERFPTLREVTPFKRHRAGPFALYTEPSKYLSMKITDSEIWTFKVGSCMALSGLLVIAVASMITK